MNYFQYDYDRHYDQGKQERVKISSATNIPPLRYNRSNHNDLPHPKTSELHVYLEQAERPWLER